MQKKYPRMKGMKDKYPSNKWKKRRFKDKDGNDATFIIVDEIIIPEKNNQEKLLCFQQLQFESGEIALRLHYYIWNETDGWIWGPYCFIAPPSDVMFLIEEAKKRNWMGVSDYYPRINEA